MVGDSFEDVEVGIMRGMFVWAMRAMRVLPGYQLP